MDSPIQTNPSSSSVSLSNSIGFALGFVSGAALYCLLADDRQAQLKNQLVKLYHQFGSGSEEVIAAFRQYVNQTSHHYSDYPIENLNLAGLLPFIPPKTTDSSSASVIQQFFSKFKNLTSTSPLMPDKKSSSKSLSPNPKKFFNRSHR